MEVLKRKVNASWRSILPIHPAFGELETILDRRNGIREQVARLKLEETQA